MPPKLNLKSCLKRDAPRTGGELRVHRRTDRGATRLRRSLIKEKEPAADAAPPPTLRDGEVVVLLYGDRDERGRDFGWVRIAAGDEGFVRTLYLHEPEGGAAGHAALVLSHPIDDALDADPQFRKLFDELDPSAQRVWRYNWAPGCQQLIAHISDCLRAALLARFPQHGARRARANSVDHRRGGGGSRSASESGHSDRSGSTAGSQRSKNSRVSFCLSQGTHGSTRSRRSD